MSKGFIASAQAAIAMSYFVEDGELSHPGGSGCFIIDGDKVIYVKSRAKYTNPLMDASQQEYVYYAWEFDMRWNCWKKVELSEYFTPSAVEKVKLYALNALDEKATSGKVIRCLFLGLRNKVNGKEFTQAFMDVFDCELTHDITMNYITQSYIFRAKSEVRDKIFMPNNPLVDDTLESFVDCMCDYLDSYEPES